LFLSNDCLAEKLQSEIAYTIGNLNLPLSTSENPQFHRLVEALIKTGQNNPTEIGSFI